MLELLHPAYYSAALALCPQAFLLRTILTTPVICAPVILPMDSSPFFFHPRGLAYKHSLPGHVCHEETRARPAIWTLAEGKEGGVHTCPLLHFEHPSCLQGDGGRRRRGVKCDITTSSHQTLAFKSLCLLSLSAMLSFCPLLSAGMGTNSKHEKNRCWINGEGTGHTAACMSTLSGEPVKTTKNSLCAVVEKTLPRILKKK